METRLALRERFLKLLFEVAVEENVEKIKKGIATLHDCISRDAKYDAKHDDTTRFPTKLSLDFEKYGRTPLLTATMSGHTQAAKYLLEAKADPNFKNAGGETALHWAAFYGHSEIMAELLKANANLDTQTSTKGATALHCAAQQGHKKCVQLLLQAKSSTGITTSNNQTALAFAFLAPASNISIASLLLESGAELRDEVYQPDFFKKLKADPINSRDKRNCLIHLCMQVKEPALKKSVTDYFLKSQPYSDKYDFLTFSSSSSSTPNTDGVELKPVTTVKLRNRNNNG